MTVRHRAAAAGVPADPVQAALLRARCLRELLVAILVQLDVVERDDVRRPLSRLREVELTDLGLHVPGIVDAPLNPHVAEAHRLRPWEPAVLRPLPRAESKHVEPV